MNRLVENKRSKKDFAQLSWWLSCYECNHDMVITRVVKSSRLPAKIKPTWVVSAAYSAWHFSTDGLFEIKYPWTGRLLWQLSHLLQNFLTTLITFIYLHLESTSRYICEAAVDADKYEKGKGNLYKTGMCQLSGFIIESLAKSLPTASSFLEIWTC